MIREKRWFLTKYRDATIMMMINHDNRGHSDVFITKREKAESEAQRGKLMKG